jgi:hypothetical protein
MNIGSFGYFYIWIHPKWLYNMSSPLSALAMISTLISTTKPICVEHVAVIAGSSDVSKVTAKSDDSSSGILDGRTRSVCVKWHYY